MNKKDNRKRIIVDFKKLTPEILGLIVEKYPDGYDEEDIISFRNAKNELVEAVEVNTDDTKYLIKVSTKLVKTMENYDNIFESQHNKIKDLSNRIEIFRSLTRDTGGVNK